MITNIKMQGVASYKSEVTLETDKKVNIIYGLNGTGKSTISNFLYDQTKPCFNNCSADISADEKALVYNQKFIHDYFYEAEDLKGVFSLSKENKDIEEKLKSAETELAALTDKLTKIEVRKTKEEDKLRTEKTKAATKTWEIKTQYTGGDRVLEYCLKGLRGNKDSLFDSISVDNKPDIKPTRDIAAIKKEVDSLSGETAQSYEELQSIEFDEKDVESNEIFNQIIVGNEDSPVSELIKQLNNSDWVRKGLEYLPAPDNGTSEQCPFCQETTITKSLSESIRNYFDESYDDSINQISSHLERYMNAAELITSIDSLESHPVAKEKLTELKLKYEILTKLISENISSIKTKKSTPSTQVTLSLSDKAVKEINEIINTINADVRLHNNRINDADNELVKLKDEFWALMRWEYDQTISSWNSIKSECNKVIKTEKSEILSCTTEIKDKRSEITALQKSTVNIEAAIESINNGLTHLGITDFFVVKHSDALYRIQRQEDSAAEFTSLSEGEKMIISFLYFCEICKGKQSADEASVKKLIVIDDPISSMSHIFVFNVAQLLKIDFFNNTHFEQVIVLTHSLYFFYELADANHTRREETQKLFRLTKNNDGSTINKMKYEEIQNDYQSYWAVVTDKNQPPALIANCMRNIIEYFFNFVQKADMSNVIQKPELQDNRFQAFCRYINRESHSLGQNIFDFKEFDYDDFREGLKLVFEVTGYPEHYQKMTKALTL